MLYSDFELTERFLNKQDLALIGVLTAFPKQKSLLPRGFDATVNRRKYLELCASLMKQIKDTYLFGGGLAFYSRQVQEALEKGGLIINLKSPIFKTYYLRRGQITGTGYLSHTSVIFRGNNPVEMLASQPSEYIWDIGKDWLIVDSHLQILFTFFQREISPVTKLCFSEVLLRFEDACQKQHERLGNLTILQWKSCSGALQAAVHVLRGGRARHCNWGGNTYCAYSPALRKIAFYSDSNSIPEMSDKVFIENLNGWSIAD